MCWLSVASFTELFDGYAQERMLANAESWGKRTPGTDNLSNIQGDKVRIEVKLSLVFYLVQC